MHAALRSAAAVGRQSHRGCRRCSTTAARVTYLHVPFAEKEAAKQLGAQWDAAKRQWYAQPQHSTKLVEQWGVAYLQVPRVETDEVKRLGARWDRECKLWYTNVANSGVLERWGIVYLDVPFAETDGAKEAGAEWDAARRRWRTHAGNAGVVDRWEVTYLQVPFSEKDEAKELGARFDDERRLWYTHKTNDALVQRWPRVPITLVGEDRSFGGNELFVDMVPQTCWFTNVRSCVDEADWDRLRHHIYERVGYHCECCGVDCRSTEGVRLEAHERWRFTSNPRTQTLARVVALCNLCHESTHMGLAEVQERGEVARAHLRRVTGMSEQECERHVQEAFETWAERSQHQWELNLSLLSNSGIRVVQPPDKAERERISAARINSERNATDGN
mmetsp:Transcript_41064/g.87462  ORF Transcript_41064/g.87462 Transcript_41064/m.87462 type:complete len:389 (+) Transcript_41064:40-1206(+)